MQDQHKFKSRMFLEKNEIETVLTDDQVLEQGTIKFNAQTYIATLFFKTIGCNFDNMTILH
jgi:hypothetical protein